MKTVPLHGGKAAGRVALVDDEDYELVGRFRWNVWESKRANGSTAGPYATTTLRREGKNVYLRMHTLLTGFPQTDHANGNGLDNRRINLRPANNSENGANSRPSARTMSSAYRGVCWHRSERKWQAYVTVDRLRRSLGFFASESDAARAYDTAAHQAWGVFAYLNFPDSAIRPTSSPDYNRYAERQRAIAAEALRYAPTSRQEWWARRQPTDHMCGMCGKSYPARSTRPSLWCSDACAKRAERQRNAARRAASR